MSDSAAPFVPAWLAAGRAFAAAHFGPGLECVFFGGSFVQGTAQPGSDLDILVLCRQVRGHGLMQVRYDGFDIDCKFHDPETLTFALRQARDGNFQNFIPDFLRRALLDPPGHPLGLLFQQKAEAVWRQGPQVKDSEFLLLRRRVQNLLSDLARHDADDPAYAVLMAEFLGVLVRADYLFNDRFVPTGRPVVRSAPPDSAAREAAHKFLQAFTQHGREDFLAFAGSFLKSLGGPAPDGFRYEYPSAQRTSFPQALSDIE